MRHNGRISRAVSGLAAIAGLLTMTGCDNVTGDVLDTIFFAFNIVDVWV